MNIKTITKYYSKLADRSLLVKNSNKINKFQYIIKNEDQIYTWDKAILDEQNLLERGLIDPNWFNFQMQMKREFEINPKEFLRGPAFSQTISCSPMPIISRAVKHYYRYIRKLSLPDKLKKYLIDDYIGKPYIYSFRYKSTFVRIQHLYQISLFEKLTAINLFSNNERIIEFGGGYGDLVNLIHKNNPNKPTYIIIDLPVLSKIQYLYLKSIYDDQVFLISDNNKKIENGAINIVPLHMIDTIDEEKSIFLATYSLTESNFNVLDILKKKDFFGSDHFFIAYQTDNAMFMEGVNIANELKSYLALNHFSNSLENDNYLFI